MLPVLDTLHEISCRYLTSGSFGSTGLRDLPSAMVDMDRWRERERERVKEIYAVRWWWNFFLFSHLRYGYEICNWFEFVWFYSILCRICGKEINLAWLIHSLWQPFCIVVGVCHDSQGGKSNCLKDFFKRQ